MKLLERAPYCPMGKKSNTKMLPSSFVKVCLEYQKKSKIRLSHGSHSEAGSIVHASACASCPVGPHIKKGRDPVSVVGDMSWFSSEEIAAIDKALSKVVVEIKHTVNKIKKAKAIKKKEMYAMRGRLIKLKDLVNQMGDILDSLLDESELYKAIETANAPKEISEVVQKVVQLEATHGVTVAEAAKQPKGSAADNAKKAFELEKSGMKRDEIAKVLNFSKKYTSTLIARYKKSVAA